MAYQGNLEGKKNNRDCTDTGNNQSSCMVVIQAVYNRRRDSKIEETREERKGK